MTGRGTSEVSRRADARPRHGDAERNRKKNENSADDVDVWARLRAEAGDFPIFACALGDHLWHRAEEGDLAAIRLLRQTHGRDMPARARIAWRDAEIREIARWLFSLRPCTVRSAAAVMARAGVDVAAKRGLGDRRPFESLTADDRAELERRVRLTLDLCGGWPGENQMRNIIKG